MSNAFPKVCLTKSNSVIFSLSISFDSFIYKFRWYFYNCHSLYCSHLPKVLIYFHLLFLTLFCPCLNSTENFSVRNKAIKLSDFSMSWIFLSMILNVNMLNIICISYDPNLDSQDIYSVFYKYIWNIVYAQPMFIMLFLSPYYSSCHSLYISLLNSMLFNARVLVIFYCCDKTP